MGMSMLRIGSCSWKFPSWSGIVYSRAHDINYLAEYGQRYRTVEIDQWFWSLFAPDQVGLPRSETVEEYVASVGKEFRFTIKAPNSITLTHFYTKGTQRGSGPNPYFLSVQLFEDFLTAIEPMRETTGSVMLQFEYLNKQKMDGPASFLKALGRFLGDLEGSRAREWPLSVEIRNPNYLTDEYRQLLREHNVAPVFCHGYYMPPAHTVFSGSRGDLPAPSVIRLLGPDRKGIEKETGKKWDRVVAPRDKELPELVDLALELLGNGDVYINVNNHYEGSAPATIEKLERLVDERRERFSQIR
jgi:uncharacterized protein YecE (DUF72 family)